MPALTDAMCRNTKRKPDRDVLLGDGDGLYLRIRPGGTRVWIVDYVVNGKRRKVNVGNYDPKGSKAETVDELVAGGRLSLAQARYVAAAWKALRRDGRDPAAERESAKAAVVIAAATEAAQPTLREVVERFMVQHIDGKKSARAIRYRFDRLVAVTGDPRIRDVTRQDMISAFERIAAGNWVPFSPSESKREAGWVFAEDGEWIWVSPAQTDLRSAKKNIRFRWKVEVLGSKSDVPPSTYGGHFPSGPFLQHVAVRTGFGTMPLMTRLKRMVNATDWCLSAAIDERRERLIHAPSADQMLERVVGEAEQAARAGMVRMNWQQSCERPGYWRLVAQMPLNEVTFDQLFNGRSGYRAQYYLSPEEGILYNRDLLEGILPVVRLAYQMQPLDIDLQLVEQSARAPHSKMWIFGETAAFNEAPAYSLNPPRWVANDAVLGRRAPLPAQTLIDVKGAFIDLDANNLFVDDLKLGRAFDLFSRGYS